MVLDKDLFLLFLVLSDREREKKTNDLFLFLKEEINWTLGIMCRKTDLSILSFSEQVCAFTLGISLCICLCIISNTW